MADFILYILTALALIFVIEGLAYALFPDTIRKMMATALAMEHRQLRQIGLVMAGLGVIMVWALRRLAGT